MQLDVFSFQRNLEDMGYHK